MMEQGKEPSPHTPPPLPIVPVPPPSMPVVPADATTQDDRTMGMLVHLLGLLTGIIGVLIIWLVKKDQSRFVDFHGKEALNFQLTVLLVCAGLMGVGFATMIGLIIAFPLVWLVGIGALVVEIMACIAANRGEWYRYPLAIRFIS